MNRNDKTEIENTLRDADLLVRPNIQRKEQRGADLRREMEGLIRTANKFGFLSKSWISPTHRIVERDDGETLELTLVAI